MGDISHGSIFPDGAGFSADPTAGLRRPVTSILLVGVPVVGRGSSGCQRCTLLRAHHMRLRAATGGISEEGPQIATRTM